ncbi:nucleotide disphospho-sugar-binding domain-containing protein [Rhizobium leguminosarum]|uniref:glycosyltransferase n=1 Tax=Rhizobium leguminosarum TaxID=384 RepID=UPI003F947D7F
MRVLIASTPAAGHLNPLLAIGRILVDAGHDVGVLTADAMLSQVDTLGAAFFGLPGAANIDLRKIEDIIPDIGNYAPGPARRLVLAERVFIDVVPDQYAGLTEALLRFFPDLILVDNTFFGVLPILGRNRHRLPVAVCGTMFLHAPRDDGAPSFLGLPPGESDDKRFRRMAAEQDRLYNRPALMRLNKMLQACGGQTLRSNYHDAMIELSDIFLQLTVPAFEFPRQNLPRSVEFVGALPIVPGQAALPAWAADLDGSRKVVLVTQGTVSSNNINQLILPTLEALGDDPDLLVVVTTGGRPVEVLPDALPANVRCARFLPFEWILPKTDVFVTNGGYGSVNQALSFGVPIVGAGVTEDKGDVNARIAWSGAGIDLKTSEPSSMAIKDAVNTILSVPIYRERASVLGDSFKAIDTPSVIIRSLETLRHAGPIRRVAGE